MAWFVTEPEELATGAAVALTPPTVSARTLCWTSVGDSNPKRIVPITD